MYGKFGEEIGQILSAVCKLIRIQLIRGGVCPNHLYLYISVPLKMSISDVMSKLKGMSVLMIFDRYTEYRDKYGRHFWVRGYYAETIRLVNKEMIKKYIEEQEECSRRVNSPL